MAYNNFPAYNAYGAYPANSYQQQYSQAMQNAAYSPQNTSNYMQQPVGIVWVDGEVGAKAYQLPPGWPVNAPMPLWDTNDTIIYLKSTNQMGMPNPIQKVRYVMEEPPKASQAMAGQSRLSQAEGNQDMSQYVKRDELEQMKEELKEAIKGVKSNGKPAV